MLKDKIITMGDNQKYYVGDDIMLSNGDYYCLASRYNEETEDCSDEFRVFKIEKDEDSGMIFLPEYDENIINYVSFEILKDNVDSE